MLGEYPPGVSLPFGRGSTQTGNEELAQMSPFPSWGGAPAVVVPIIER
jgi:hypothetical protein